MDSDLECQHQVAKKFLSEEGKKEEKGFLPDSRFTSLKKRKDFLITRKKGISLYGKFLILNVANNNLSFCRVGLTVTRKMGNAVKRNFIKRVIKSCLRACTLKINKNVDIEIIPKKNTRKFEFSLVKNDLIHLLQNYNNLKH